MLIRPVQEHDYAQLSEIWKLVYPEDLLSEKELKHQDESYLAPCKFARYVAEQNGVILGSSNFEQHQGMYHPQKFFINVWVHPEHEKKGVGGALYEHLWAKLIAFNPLSLRTQVRENQLHAVAFAETRGFQETKRDWQSVLELKHYKPEKFDVLEQKALLKGVVIKSFAEFEDKAYIEKAFFNCFNDVRQDVPRSEPATPLSWEFIQTSMYSAPDFYPEGTFLAFLHDEMIGLSQFWKGESNDDLYTGLTGVKQKARGKGVATALKLRALRFAKTTAAAKVYTENDTKNLEMIAINDKLGFKKLPAWLSVKKEIRDAS